jgi:hypothetical protein
MSEHFHHCPECYMAWPCNDKCTIEPDLQDEDREFGAHCECPPCRELQPCIRTASFQYELSEHTGDKSCPICNPPASPMKFIQMEIKLDEPVIVLDQDWFDKYNGLK